MKSALSFSFAAVVSATAFAGIPVLYLSDYETRDIEVEGATVTVDEARRIDMWKDGVVPSSFSDEYKETKERSKEYANHEVDFIVSFDRDVEAGSVALYGEIDSKSAIVSLVGLNRVWVPVEIPKMRAGSEVRLVLQMLGDEVGIRLWNSQIIVTPRYFSAMDVVQRFVCAAKNMSKANIGTTMTVDVCLFSGGTRERVTGFSYTFSDDEPEMNWFNANISRYDEFPRDVSRASGGTWTNRCGTPLSDIAELSDDGRLSVDTDTSVSNGLMFCASRRTRMRNGMTVEADIEVVTEMSCARPPIPGDILNGSSLGSLFVMEADGETNFFGLAMVAGSATNGIVRLESESVPPANGEAAAIRFRIMSNGRDRFASYFVNGEPLAYGEKELIPVACGKRNREAHGVVLIGSTVVSSCRGSVLEGDSLDIRIR